MATAPTYEQLAKAQEYALSKLCTEIPGRFSPGLTAWDENTKECKITQKGCQPSSTNPISRPPFTSSGKVISEANEQNQTFGWFWKKFMPGFFVMRTTKNSGGRKVCAQGNFMLYQWCEYPESRNLEGADYIRQAGVTNVPKFDYIIENGKERCTIPKEYCDAKGVSYDAQKKDCYVSASQKVAEFFTGSVFYRRQRAASDKRLKKNIKLFKSDFPMKGVNVYFFEWNDTANALYGFTGQDVGFIADELDPAYVKEDHMGYKYIDMDIEDEYMRKISAFLQIKNVLLHQSEHDSGA